MKWMLKKLSYVLCFSVLLSLSAIAWAEETEKGCEERLLETQLELTVKSLQVQQLTDEIEILRFWIKRENERDIMLKTKPINDKLEVIKKAKKEVEDAARTVQ